MTFPGPSQYVKTNGLISGNSESQLFNAATVQK